MHRQHRLRLDALDPILPNLDPLRQIPQEKVDQHATDARGGRDALHGDDRRGAYGDLLARAARKFFVRLERAHERGGVGEEPEVVQDLRDAVVCEHRELADAAREERVWIAVGWRGEGCPGLGDQDLGAFPEEDCVSKVFVCVISARAIFVMKEKDEAKCHDY